MALDARQIRKIHAIRRSIGLDDDTYHDLLDDLFSVRSCKKLTVAQYCRLLREFEAKGAKRKKGKTGYPGRPNLDDPDRGRLFRKIEALLTEAGRPWSYADAIAQRMCKVQRVKWCRPPELGKIVSALMYDQRRRKGGTA